MGTGRLSRQDISPAHAGCVWRCRRVRRRSAGRALTAMARGWHPAAAPGAQAAAGWSDVLRKAGDGDLRVSVFAGMQWRGHRTASAISPSARLLDYSPVGPGSASGDGCSIGCACTWRRACGDTPEPTAVVIDSRSCRSAPSCFDRGVDGGKKIRGVKIHVAVDKYGIPLAIDVARRTGMTPKPSFRFCVSSPMAASRAQPSAISATGQQRLAEAGQALGITVEAIARGRDGQFIPAGICWVVERSFAWLSRYRRLNTIFERSKEHPIAFVAIAFISILLAASSASSSRNSAPDVDKQTLIFPLASEGPSTHAPRRF